MAPPLDPDHHWGDAASSEGRLRLSHLEVGLPMTCPAAAAAFGDRARHVSEALAPFVAWLATQDIDEAARRRYSDAVERFLVWCLDDTGLLGDRRARYVRVIRQHNPDDLDDVRAGLERWTEHRWLLSQTLPADG